MVRIVVKFYFSIFLVDNAYASVLVNQSLRVSRGSSYKQDTEQACETFTSVQYYYIGKRFCFKDDISICVLVLNTKNSS